MAARKLHQKRFLLDGEAVVLGVEGVSDFDALHSGKHNEEVQLCAFDILVEGGDDLRKLPLSMRKTRLERLLARRPEGIFVNPFERGEIGPDHFRAACRMGLEGMVSKHRDRARALSTSTSLKRRLPLSETETAAGLGLKEAKCRSRLVEGAARAALVGRIEPELRL